MVLEVFRDAVSSGGPGQSIVAHCDHSGHKCAVAIEEATDQGACRFCGNSIMYPIHELIGHDCSDPLRWVTGECCQDVKALWLFSPRNNQRCSCALILAAVHKIP